MTRQGRDAAARLGGAAAARGERGALAQAARAVLQLNPAEIYRYLRDSRIGERTWPRLRAKLAGSF